MRGNIPIVSKVDKLRRHSEADGRFSTQSVWQYLSDFTNEMNRKPSTYLRGISMEKDSKRTISYDPEVIHREVKTHYDEKFAEPDDILSRNEMEIKSIFKAHFITENQIDIIFTKEKLLQAVSRLPMHTASGTD